MTDARATTGQRLVDAGLRHYVHDLLDRGRPAILLVPGLTAAVPVSSYRTPEPVQGLDTRVVAVSGDGRTRLALLDNGTVMAWGANESGQLGDGTRADRPRPVQVLGVTDAIAIAPHGAPLAVLDGGGVVGWGSNGHGQLGGGPGPNRLVPGPVPGLERDVIWVAGSTRAIKRDGTAWVLPFSRSDSRLRPECVQISVPPPGLRPGAWTDWLGVLWDGTVLSWPYSRDSPRRLPSLDHVVDVCELAGGALALRDNGSVVRWQNRSDMTASGRPEVVIDRGVVAIAGDRNSPAFALRSDGSVWAWGSNFLGALGTGTEESQLTPVRVPGLDDVVAIDIGVALRSDGSVWDWGGEAPTRDVGARLPIGHSKLGGRPDMAVGSQWPSVDARPLNFVGQVNLGGTAALDDADLLPPSGLLLFFYDSVYHPSFEIVSVVTFFPEGTPLARQEFPEEMAPFERTDAIAIVPQPDFTVNPAAVLPKEVADEGQMRWECHWSDADLPPRHRMLGFPDLIQPTPEIGEDILLLQVDMYRLPHGSGLLYFIISEDDLRARRFQNSQCYYESD